MTIGLLLAALAAQNVDVQVMSTGTGQGIRAKVHMENGDETVSRSTGTDGRTTFSNVTCSPDTRFWARSTEPSHPNPSPRRTCTDPVRLKVRPAQP